MPMVIWPAPRQLPPGRSVSASTRVDIGPVAQYLANHPLEAVELVVRATPSPREESVRGQETSAVVSALPTIKPETPVILRRGLLSDRTAEGYRAAVAELERQLTSGELTQRVTAARRVAALLSWIRQTEKSREGIPATIQPAVNKRQLLGLMSAALRDPSAVVRAEIITALEYADMGDAMLNEIGLVVEDPSPLVRFRVAELIGASGTKGSRTLIDLYAKDPDAQVRLMAQAFLHEWRKGQPASQPVSAPVTTQPAKT
jgi:HEAT repeat protein